MSDSVVVLHVFGRMERGGAELRTLDLLRVVDCHRFALHFCALSGLPGELDEEIGRLGSSVHLLPLGVGFPFGFVRLLARLRVSAVHSHVFLFSGVILLLARLARVPVRIAHFRSSSDGHPSTLARRVVRRVLRWLVRMNATHILGVSAGTMSTAWGGSWFEDPRCKVIYNGLAMDAYRGPRERGSVRAEFGFPHDTRLVVHVGRMAPPKNHQHLLRVFAHFSSREPRARLLLVGCSSTPTATQVREEIRQLGLADRVALAGTRSDVPRLLGAADLMIFPSLWEGLPGAVLEACAAGVPVLASDIPGVLEIAAHFPGVTTLPLACPIAEWADRALALLATDDHPAASFDDSPFSLEACASQMTRLWSP